ncbi:hypothetical protein chiPu_0024425, partial [Chiloscyllium punctatum]|nr:hypothetical protein [Chiloscyllium punctatum]
TNRERHGHGRTPLYSCLLSAAKKEGKKPAPSFRNDPPFIFKSQSPTPSRHYAFKKLIALSPGGDGWSRMNKVQ